MSSMTLCARASLSVGSHFYVKKHRVAKINTKYPSLGNVQVLEIQNLPNVAFSTPPLNILIYHLCMHHILFKPI
jgi:hypothetical protein